MTSTLGRVFSAGLFLLVVLRAESVLAQSALNGSGDDLKSVLDAPAPPTLPALAHRDLTFNFELTAAVIQPKDQDRSGDAFAYFMHTDAEYPIVPRQWFIGLSNDIAAAALPGVGTAFLLGNPEISGRGLWSSSRGLSSGGGLGIVLPTPRALSPVETEVLRTVRTVKPWDLASFSSLTLTFRPWIDIRHVVSGLIFQLRQGIDWSISLNGPEEIPGGTPSGSNPRITNFTARLTFYMGYRLSEWLGIGVELWEVYEVTKELANDDNRAAFAVSPSIRLMLPRIQPALSFLFPVTTPLRGDVESYYAGRMNIGFNFDVRPNKDALKSAMTIEDR
ncbi:MAG: hypothetical protein IPK82_21155 [Polyangiaceae bacterium]|nr:hypothetical protein [Polyangiaceae bacterium]